MEQPDKNIDWDKLLPKLDDLHQNDAPGTPEDSEEARHLALAREINRRLQDNADDPLFPAESGWQRFRQTVENERKGRVRRIYTIAVAAAAVLFAAAVGIRFLYTGGSSPVKQSTVANAYSPAGVVIRSSGGKVLQLSDTVQQLQWQEGVAVSAGGEEITYTAGTAQSASSDTLVVPRGNRARITLPDGTKVWVNADSRLVYPAAFTGTSREVEIDGEAYFEVAADVSRPFKVRTGGMDVEVLGTGFNVNTYSKTIYTTLVSGKVKASAGGAGYILQPGQQAAYNRANATLERRPADVRPVTAWKDDLIIAEDASLADIVNVLEREYDYHIEFEDESLRERSFTLDMPKPASLEKLLLKLNRTTGDLQYRINGRTVYLYKR